MPSYVKDIDKGLKRILKDLKDADRMFVKVGILSTAPEAEKGMTMAKLGTIHEYGAPSVGIPARPFKRQTFERIKNEIIKFNKAEIKSIILGKSNATRSLKRLGEYCSREIKREFDIGKFTENKPATVKAWARLMARGKARQEKSNKGRGIQNAKFNAGTMGKRPLIATRRLRNSINYEVFKK